MIGPEITVPDVTEAVVGYRQFALDRYQQHNYRLVSPHQGEGWLTVEKAARCTREVKVPEGIVLPHPPKPHKAPYKGCGCGIYVYFDPCPVKPRHDDMWSMSVFGGPSWSSASRVQALMSLSGTIEVHARGMRAERGRICALADNATLTVDERAALHEIARDFRVPVVQDDDLPNLATEFGRPLDESLRPAAEPAREDAGGTLTYGQARLMLFPAPRTSRRRWQQFIPFGLNATAAVSNVGVLAATGGTPLTIACIGLSSAVAFKLYPRRTA